MYNISCYITMAHICFLTVSCIRTLVAPTNPSIITSIGTEVNNDPLKFKRSNMSCKS